MTTFGAKSIKENADENVVVANILTNVVFFESHNGRQIGWLPKWNRVELRVAVEQVPKSMRKTFRSLTNLVAVPKSTLHHMMAK
jgi:hypothetical protein